MTPYARWRGEPLNPSWSVTHVLWLDTGPGDSFRDGALDEAAFRRFVDWQIDNGSSALVPCGTTGESATLDNDEHHKVIALCVEQAAGRVPVIAGAGSNDTKTALWHMQVAKDLGADAALLVAPYYNRPSQAGLLAHFSVRRTMRPA